MIRRALTRGLTMLELLVVVSVLAVLAMIVTPMLGGRDGEDGIVGDARAAVTWTTMTAVRKAINDEYYGDQFESLPYPPDSDALTCDPEAFGFEENRQLHPQLAFLYVNPLLCGTTEWNYDPHTQRGWSGPYLSPGGTYLTDDFTGESQNFSQLYGEVGDPCPVDGWGQPIVIQQPQTLGSTASMRDRTYARLVSAGPNGVLDTPPDVQVPSESQIDDDLVMYLTRGL